jgi:hypothetical protein
VGREVGRKLRVRRRVVRRRMTESMAMAGMVSLHRHLLRMPMKLY